MNEERTNTKNCEDNENEEHKDPSNEETTCGYWIIKGPILQSLANKKVLAMLVGLSGCFFSATMSYYNGCLTTMEKRFKMPTRDIGFLLMANDITRLIASIFLNYYASKGHRPRWCAFGLSCVSIFCFLNIVPHLIYGPGEDALQLTLEYGNDFVLNRTVEMEQFSLKKDLCGSKGNKTCNINEDTNVVPFTIWFISQLVVGIASAVYFPLSYSYMDDNVKKSKSPTILSFSIIMRILGPSIGYGIVSMCLKFYIAPELTPTINNTDPRWMGAWWSGWIFFGLVMLGFSFMYTLLPKTLPRTAARKETLKNLNDISQIEAHGTPSLKDMLHTAKRLFSNKIYVYNQLGLIANSFGLMPFRIYLPKYIETQYRKSASAATFYTGSVGLVFSITGIALSGFIVQKYKPSSRSMALYNVFVHIICFLCIMSFLIIGCPFVNQQETFLSTPLTNTGLSCDSECHCENVKYSPICDVNRQQTFISPCHAGCTQKTTLGNGTKLYTNCSCIIPPDIFEVNDQKNKEFFNGMAISGPCLTNCDNYFYAFIGIICLIKLINTSAKITNFLIELRCVEERDKTFSLGLTAAVMSLFAYMPAPVFYGYILDTVCLLWGKTCTGTGNCWLYDANQMRELLVYIAVSFLFIRILFSTAIVYEVKHLNIFDDTPKRKNLSQKEQEESEALQALK